MLPRRCRCFCAWRRRRCGRGVFGRRTLSSGRSRIMSISGHRKAGCGYSVGSASPAGRLFPRGSSERRRSRRSWKSRGSRGSIIMFMCRASRFGPGRRMSQRRCLTSRFPIGCLPSRRLCCRHAGSFCIVAGGGARQGSARAAARCVVTA